LFTSSSQIKLKLGCRFIQLQQMLKDQTDYSIPEKQQELRGFVGELDNTAFKDCNGSEVRIPHSQYITCRDGPSTTIAVDSKCTHWPGKAGVNSQCPCLCTVRNKM